MYLLEPNGPIGAGSARFPTASRWWEGGQDDGVMSLLTLLRTEGADKPTDAL